MAHCKPSSHCLQYKLTRYDIFIFSSKKTWMWSRTKNFRKKMDRLHATVSPTSMVVFNADDWNPRMDLPKLSRGSYSSSSLLLESLKHWDDFSLDIEKNIAWRRRKMAMHNAAGTVWLSAMNPLWRWLTTGDDERFIRWNWYNCNETQCYHPMICGCTYCIAKAGCVVIRHVAIPSMKNFQLHNDFRLSP